MEVVGLGGFASAGATPLVEVEHGSNTNNCLPNSIAGAICGNARYGNGIKAVAFIASLISLTRPDLAGIYRICSNS